MFPLCLGPGSQGEGVLDWSGPLLSHWQSDVIECTTCTRNVCLSNFSTLRLSWHCLQLTAPLLGSVHGTTSRKCGPKSMGSSNLLCHGHLPLGSSCNITRLTVVQPLPVSVSCVSCHGYAKKISLKFVMSCSIGGTTVVVYSPRDTC